MSATEGEEEKEPKKNVCYKNVITNCSNYTRIYESPVVRKSHKNHVLNPFTMPPKWFRYENILKSVK